MIFIVGLPKRHTTDIVNTISKALPSGEFVSGLPAMGNMFILTDEYIVECIETLVAFRAGRTACFETGLSVVVVRQPGESLGARRSLFFPYALVSEIDFPRRFARSPAQSSRDKNELGRLLEKESKRLIAIARQVSNYLTSRSNRTPMLLPLRHFKELELKKLLEAAWQDLPTSPNVKARLDDLCSEFERLYPFVKNGKDKPGRFVNTRDVWFTVPGRDLHAEARGSGGGHRPECLLNGVLRVGGSIRTGFHYDCTRAGARHEGQFANCHDQIVAKVGKPHLNVYPNDYIR